MRLHGFCIFYDQSRHHTSTNYRLACQTSLDNRKKMFLRRVFHSCPPRFIQKGVNKYQIKNIVLENNRGNIVKNEFYDILYLKFVIIESYIW